MKKTISLMMSIIIISIKCFAANYYDPYAEHSRFNAQQAEYVQYVQEKIRQHRLAQEAKKKRREPVPSYIEAINNFEEFNTEVKKKKKKWYQRW